MEKNTGSTRASDGERNTCDLALAKIFFGCNIPFNVVDSPFFRNFITTLNSTYKSPSRHYSAEKLVDQVYNESVNEQKMKLNNVDSVLLIDGWKNSSANTKNVVSVNDGRRVFLESFDITGQSETGELLTSIVEQSAKIAKDIYNANIYAVVTDNASPMISMGNCVDLWHSTCSSHSGNLLAKSLVDKDFAYSLSDLLKEFKSPGLEEKLIDKGGKKIILPGDTRWCSYRDAFMCALLNIPLMRQIKDEGSTIKEKNVELLDNEDLEFEIQISMDLWDPICVLINKCQKSTCNIADEVELWQNLLKNESLQDIRNHVEARIGKALWPVGLAANLLHPTYRGEELTEMQLESASDFLKENLSEQGRGEFTMYANNDGIFRKLTEKNITSAFIFSKMAKRAAPELSTLAIKLMNIPAATAEIEIVFSNWAYIHCLLRNRLKS